jgi:hypothetical protein
VAETCQALLVALPAPASLRPQALAVDFQIGRHLLAMGVEAGVLAAGQNLDAWERDLEPTAYRRRLAALQGVEST